MKTKSPVLLLIALLVLTTGSAHGQASQEDCIKAIDEKIAKAPKELENAMWKEIGKADVALGAIRAEIAKRKKADTQAASDKVHGEAKAELDKVEEARKTEIAACPAASPPRTQLAACEKSCHANGSRDRDECIKKNPRDGKHISGCSSDAVRKIADCKAGCDPKAVCVRAADSKVAAFNNEVQAKANAAAKGASDKIDAEMKEQLHQAESKMREVRETAPKEAKEKLAKLKASAEAEKAACPK